MMFSAGPMKMPLDRYLFDIGFSYLMLPVITAGMGAATAIGRPPAPAPPVRLPTSS
jgi:hypothetical protein